MPTDKDFKRQVRARMTATNQSYMTSRRQLLTGQKSGKPTATAVGPTELADFARNSGIPGRDLAVAADALATFALERVEAGGLLLCGVHAGIAETGAILEWLVATYGFQELFFALPSNWDDAIRGACAGGPPKSYPRPPSDVTADLLASLLRIGANGWHGQSRCVGETPELGPSARDWDESVGSLVDVIVREHSNDRRGLVLIRPFNLSLVPYRFRGSNALPWSTPTDQVFTDSDTVHPLGSQLAARGTRVASVQFFGPTAPDPHDLRPRLAIGTLQVPTWTPATALSYDSDR